MCQDQQHPEHQQQKTHLKGSVEDIAGTEIERCHADIGAPSANPGDLIRLWGIPCRLPRDA